VSKAIYLYIHDYEEDFRIDAVSGMDKKTLLHGTQTFIFPIDDGLLLCIYIIQMKKRLYIHDDNT